jgi:hypothetical protein
MGHGNELKASHDRADDAGQQSGAKRLRERIVAERRKPSPQQGAGAGAERDKAKRKPLASTEDDAQRGGAGRRQENKARQRDRRQMPDRRQLRLRVVKSDPILAKSIDQVVGRRNLLHVDANRHRGDPMQARAGRIVDPEHNLAPSRHYCDVDAERPAQAL